MRDDTECACGAFLPDVGGTPEGSGTAIGGLIVAALGIAALILVGLAAYRFGVWMGGVK